MPASISLWLLAVVSLGLSIEATREGGNDLKVEIFRKFSQDCRAALKFEQFSDISHLRDLVLRANGSYNYGPPGIKIPFFPISRKAIDEGTVNFMLGRQKNYKHAKGKKEFDELFDTHIKSACDVILNKLNPIIEDYNYLLQNSRELFRDINSLEWLANSRICSAIRADNDFRKQIYERASKVKKG